ncbi:hypothetical protein H7K45_27900 [Mycobacterium yunnanensis]|uniref:Uncharacterized protein n=1 Tax=Mycobacterium yunnanensis TaxID=368477 RepID=A0A9X2Z756_9MYCO|nr:hypothetical protein [Mycobacterium yunnanensis]MCV7424375.1 hypothetical protein [Mycobacterium yunnanensis]
MPDVELCLCGHAHFSGDRCWCGCTKFTTDRDDQPRDLVGCCGDCEHCPCRCPQVNDADMCVRFRSRDGQLIEVA